MHLIPISGLYAPIDTFISQRSAKHSDYCPLTIVRSRCSMEKLTRWGGDRSDSMSTASVFYLHSERFSPTYRQVDFRFMIEPFIRCRTEILRNDNISRTGNEVFHYLSQSCCTYRTIYCR